MAIPYGHDYPDPEWPDSDDQPGDHAAPAVSIEAAHSGQVRIAYRLAQRFCDRLLFVHSIGWHYWDGKRWAYDDIGAAKRAVIEILRTALAESLDDKQLRADVRRCESAAGVSGVLDIASALKPFAATVRDLDSDPYLLNVANGTLDLRTMKLSPHNQADRLTKVTRAAYTDDRQPGQWHAFINAVLPEEDVRGYVQRHIGVALCGNVIEHLLSIWTGTGANGKTTATGGLQWALGDYASTAEPELLLHRSGAHPTGELDLMGRRLVFVAETDEGRRFAESTMKRLTGGDTIRARRMRQDFIEFTPSHTPILVTNHLPAVSGDDPAIWRRIRVVPFEVVITPEGRDPELPERLQLAADEILTWAIDGWREYQAGGLAEPDAVRKATHEYQSDSDAVGRFIEDECVTGSPALKATTSQLFEGWHSWRGREGAPEMSRKAFGQALDRHGYRVTEKARDGRWREGIAAKGAEA